RLQSYGRHRRVRRSGAGRRGPREQRRKGVRGGEAPRIFFEVFVRRQLSRAAVVVAMAVVASGCAAGVAFRRGDSAMRAGDLDKAVAYYRTAVQKAPDNARFKIALERAMVAASRAHLERARAFEDQNQLEAAVSEYRLASEYDPSNRQAADKVV